MDNVSQEEAINALEDGGNYLVSGEAGTGKTYTINQFHNQTENNVVLTATTGIAAINAGGSTIHSFLSLGTSTRPFELPKLFGRWDKIKKSSTPWDKQKMAVMRSLDTLVIDEASMLRRDQFELIEPVLAHIKDNNSPFGGVQVILVGDFLQLPPVITDEDLKKYPDLKAPYCFQSDIWKQTGIYSLNLTQNYRQSSGVFLKALGEIRNGLVSDEVDGIFSSRISAKLETDLNPIKLFPHNYKVEQENMNQLNQLPDEKIHSHAITTGKEFDIEQLKKDCPADFVLSFCNGAQIMMLTNDPEQKFANGTMGRVKKVDPVVVELSDGTEIGVDKFTWERKTHLVQKDKITEKVVATLTQYPFRLAYSTSIHKSQGLTMDFVEVDLKNCFSVGQAYTALSRVKTLEGLRLTGWNKKSIMADKRVLDFYGY